jgi:hypothetical protein
MATRKVKRSLFGRHTRRGPLWGPTGPGKGPGKTRSVGPRRGPLAPKGGKTRRGKGIGPLREGELSQFGYSGVAKLSDARRHAALKLAVRKFGALSVIRKLNAVAVYTKNTSPKVSRIFRSDMAWIRREFR